MAEKNEEGKLCAKTDELYNEDDIEDILSGLSQISASHPPSSHGDMLSYVGLHESRRSSTPSTQRSSTPSKQAYTKSRIIRLSGDDIKFRLTPPLNRDMSEDTNKDVNNILNEMANFFFGKIEMSDDCTGKIRRVNEELNENLNKMISALGSEVYHNPYLCYDMTPFFEDIDENSPVPEFIIHVPDTEKPIAYPKEALKLMDSMRAFFHMRLALVQNRNLDENTLWADLTKVHHELTAFIYNCLDVYGVRYLGYYGKNERDFKVTNVKFTEVRKGNVYERQGIEVHYKQVTHRPDILVGPPTVETTADIPFEVCVSSKRQEGSSCKTSSVLEQDDVKQSHEGESTGVKLIECGGGDSTQLKPVERGGGDSTQLKPVERGAGDSTQLKPVERGAGDSTQVKPVESGARNSTEVKPIERSSYDSYTEFVAAKRNGSRMLPRWMEKKQLKNKSYIQNKLYGEMIIHLMSCVARCEDDVNDNPNSDIKYCEAFGFFVWRRYVVPVRLSCTKQYAKYVLRAARDGVPYDKLYEMMVVKNAEGPRYSVFDGYFDICKASCRQALACFVSYLKNPDVVSTNKIP